MIPTIKSRIHSYVALFGVCIAAATAPLIAADNAQITVAGPGGTRLRVEAVDPSIPALYLNPGELSLMLYVDQPDFLLNTLELARSTNAPTTYPAQLATRAGIAEVDRTGGSTGKGAIRNLGRVGSSLTWGVVAPRTGEATLRFRYQSFNGGALPFALKSGDTEARPLALLLTGSEWKTFDVKVPLHAGANRVQLSGLVDGWNSITVEHLELIMP